LSQENIRTIILKAVYDQKGMGAYNACIDDDAVTFLSNMADGDARNALNAVELGILSTEQSDDGKIHITLQVAEECIQKRAVRYDKDGDNHYDIISAFIKSMRGSDPDAAVFYLAKMLYGGESVTFIARRIMICACEDVGNADPNAICVATSCAQAVERVGMPEAQIILAHAAIYVACAPKSNSVVNAIFAANDAVKNENTGQVPVYLRDSHYGGARKLGHVGYKYAHDYPNHYVEQQYLPDELVGRRFYEPSDNGYEKDIKEYFRRIKRGID
jgi:putative ATPase